MSADARALSALVRVVAHIGAAAPAMDGLLDEVYRAQAARDHDMAYRLCDLIRELDREAHPRCHPASAGGRVTRAELEVIDARLSMEDEVRRNRYPSLLALLDDYPAARARMARAAEDVADHVEMMAAPDYEVRAATFRAIATDLRRGY